MKLWRFLLILGISFALDNAQAATTYPVADFSPEYYATVTIHGNLKDTFLPGVVRVYSKKSKSPIITVKSDELTPDIQSGKVKANVQELPYGEQSVLIYNDFNFDGRKDLAIMDGQNSCYHGPSFQIYLATPKGFQPSPEFTRLAQDYCGMFATDKAKRQISVMTKDGCCWHQFETYSVVNNKPYLQSQATIQGMQHLPFYIQEDDKVRQGKGFKTSTSYLLDDDAANSPDSLILSFNLQSKPQKTVYILKDDENNIDYLLVDNDGTVELGTRLADYLDYPKFRNEKEIDIAFIYTPEKNSLNFYRKGVSYTVTDTPTRLGVEVIQNGKTSFLPGVVTSKKGSLKKLSSLVIQNMAGQK